MNKELTAYIIYLQNLSPLIPLFFWGGGGMRAITAGSPWPWLVMVGESCLCVCGIYYRNGGEGTGPLIQSVAGEGSE